MTCREGEGFASIGIRRIENGSQVDHPVGEAFTNVAVNESRSFNTKFYLEKGERVLATFKSMGKAHSRMELNVQGRYINASSLVKEKAGQIHRCSEDVVYKRTNANVIDEAFNEILKKMPQYGESLEESIKDELNRK